MAARANPAAEAAATWTHRRRDPGAADNVMLRRVFSNQEFFWSCDVRSKHLVPQYLHHVHCGIVSAAADLRLTLDERDLSWLEAHGGRFQMFIPLKSGQYRTKLASVQLKGKSAEVIAEHCLTKNHQVCDASSRFCRGSGVDNYHFSLESATRQLWNFLAMIGAYHCMLILLPNAPKECCSVSTRNLKAYILHKYLPHGTPLHENWNSSDGKIFDIHGRHMKCEGTTQNKDGFDCILASISQIHKEKARQHAGGYILQCPGCFHNFKNGVSVTERFQPCESHTGRFSQYCCMGNPAPSFAIKAVVDWIDKESNRRGYEVKQKSFILPQDLLDMQKHVASVQYNLWDLQNYTVILGGIAIAGRFDGYGDVHMEDFTDCKALFEVTELGIKSLAQRVKEKTDKMWHQYLIYFNDACPLLCYLRHLLVFVHCANLEETGRIFTDEAELNSSDKSTPNQWTSFLDKEKFSKWLQERVMENCQDPENMNIGVHSPRATFYLFYILSGGEFPGAMRNARHETEWQARKYHRDALACMLKLISGGALPKFPPCRETLVHKSGRVQKRILRMDPNRKEVPNLKAAAEFFVQTMLHINPTHAKYRDPKYLLELSYKKNFSTSSAPSLGRDMSEAILTLPPEFQGRMKLQLQNVLSQFHQCPTCLQGQQGQALPPNSSVTAGINLRATGVHQLDPMPGEAPTGQAPLRLPRRLKFLFPCQVNDALKSWKFDFREGFSKQLKSLNSDGQAKFVYELYLEICSLNPTPGDKIQSFNDGRKMLHPRQNCVFSRWLSAFCKCIQSCHGGDLAKFQESNPLFKSTRAQYKCSACADL
jgi:hypothetical protein